MIQAKAETGWLDRPLSGLLALDVEKLLYAVILVAAVVTRFYDLGTRVMSHDESLHTYYSWELYQGRGFQHTPLMHGPFQFHILAFTYFLLGDDDFTARVPVALFGVAAVFLLYHFRHWLGRTGALVAAVLITISPYILYYSRYTRNESFVVVWGLLTAWSVFRYLESRQSKWLILLTVATVFHSITKETSFIYTAIWLILMEALLVKDLLSAQWSQDRRKRAFETLLIAGLIGLAVGGGLYAVGRSAGAAADTAASAGKAAGLLIAGLGLAVLAGAHLLALLDFKNDIRQFPALDLLIVLGTFVLPQLAAFPVKALGGNPTDYTSPSQLWQTGFVWFVLQAMAVAVGVVWNWRLWLILAGLWYGIFIPLQTTIFTNGGGFWTGMVGSLGYWLEQQPVQRGSQPWYYYIMVQLPVYEYLPVVGSLIALGYVIGDRLRQWRRSSPEASAFPVARAIEHADGFGGGGNGHGHDPIGSAPAVPLIGVWAALIIAALSIAGEKMPWLTVHMALPLILLSGWSIGRLIHSIDWEAFLNRKGWVVALILPVVLTAVAFLGTQLWGTHRPFQGKSLDQLQASMAFLSALTIAAIGLIGIYFAGRESDWVDLNKLTGLMAVGGLGILTSRTAFMASYINYNDPTEYLVYAHSATGVKTVLVEVENISRRTTDGLDVNIAYDDDVSWPWTWYMRNYRNQVFFGGQPTRESLDQPLVVAGDGSWARVEPLLGNRYYTFEYIRMVWPMQEYFDLNGERIKGALLSPDYRQAMWDIWWNRDYTKYGELTSVDYNLSRWPVVDRMRFYVRKDLAAQIWQYGVGPTALKEDAPEDPYVKNHQTLNADVVWGAEGTGNGQFFEPRDVAVGPDGSVYVADTGNGLSGNHRIQKFDANGNFLLAFGGPSGEANPAPPGALNEPWGIAVGPDGSVYVADTWNHRVQKFSPDGQFVTTWGTYGQGGGNAFWGPRDVAVDSQGRVFVTDTGNKRIAVFDSAGNYLFDVGLGGGYEAGYFDEPVGLAFGPDDRLYVADTWNRRVQVFQPDPATGQLSFLSQWVLEGTAWNGQSLDNKPYIAVDSRSRAYVSDPEGYRILVFDADGKFLTSWGDYGAESSTMALPAGMGVSPEDQVYVADTKNHRIMRFTLP